MKEPTPPLLHVVARDAETGRPDFQELVGRLQAACGAHLALHLRLREATGADFLELASVVARDAGETGGWCVVNERLDVALAAGADAVQLGERALPVSVACDVAAGRLALGASVHGAREARAAAAAGANYLVLGTIFPSRTHPGGRPHGPAILERCRDAGVPVIAIGGIDARRAPEVREAGASGMAVVRAVWGTGDPVAAAERLIGAWG